ncbi:hypothetical protein BLOT_006713 [Blomia tropicalis]|nr:hypothetical protein BLOT_006713 [Blomia tropicalis]
MLAVVVAVFATLWLPYRALVVYNSFAYPPYMELWYLMFAKTMIFVNSAINPIIYSACSIKFRREFKRMLTCNRNSSSYYNSRSNRTGLSVGFVGGVGGGNGTMITTTPADAFYGDTLRANRSMATLRSHSSGNHSLQYCTTSASVNNLNLSTNRNLSSQRRKSSTFLSPSHALMMNYDHGNRYKSGLPTTIRTSASVSKLATYSHSTNVDCSNGKTIDHKADDNDDESISQSNGTQATAHNGNMASNTNQNMNSSSMTPTSVTLIYSDVNSRVVTTTAADSIVSNMTLVKKDTNLVINEQSSTNVNHD